MPLKTTIKYWCKYLCDALICDRVHKMCYSIVSLPDSYKLLLVHEWIKGNGPYAANSMKKETFCPGINQCYYPMNNCYMQMNDSCDNAAYVRSSFSVMSERPKFTKSVQWYFLCSGWSHAKHSKGVWYSHFASLGYLLVLFSEHVHNVLPVSAR